MDTWSQMVEHEIGLLGVEDTEAIMERYADQITEIYHDHWDELGAPSSRMAARIIVERAVEDGVLPDSIL